MKSSGIGGQAVIEGVMMRNKAEYAIAVRKPDKEIEIKKEKCSDPKSRNTFGLERPTSRTYMWKKGPFWGYWHT